MTEEEILAEIEELKAQLANDPLDIGSIGRYNYLVEELQKL